MGRKNKKIKRNENISLEKKYRKSMTNWRKVPLKPVHKNKNNKHQRENKSIRILTNKKSDGIIENNMTKKRVESKKR